MIAIDLSHWDNYCRILQLEDWGLCLSCEGDGDHGYCAEGTYLHNYICHACGGTGRFCEETKE